MKKITIQFGQTNKMREKKEEYYNRKLRGMIREKQTKLVFQVKEFKINREECW
jgi:hypothetical protein